MRLIISDNMIFSQQISDEIVLSDSIIANHGLVLTKCLGGNLNMAFSQFDYKWDLFAHSGGLFIFYCCAFVYVSTYQH